MSELFTTVQPFPELDDPLLVVMLTGWVDAGAAAATAMASIDAAIYPVTHVVFDSDTFIDYRARRPTMELRDGRNTRIVWPETTLAAGRSPDGRDVVTLTGPEPDSAWRRFAAAVTDLVGDLGVRRAVLLGAYPFACPHTRPARLTFTTTSDALLAEVPYLRSSLDAPAGMGAVLEHTLAERGIDAIGLWAQVPHYLGVMPYPAASLTLLAGLRDLTGLEIDTTLLAGEAAALRQRIDQLVLANPQHLAMVGELESLYDAEYAGGQPLSGGLTLGGDGADQQLPSADELAAEVERFLREQPD